MLVVTIKKKRLRRIKTDSKSTLVTLKWNVTKFTGDEKNKGKKENFRKF